MLAPVFGGATRQHSVRNGLTALEPRAPALVLVHDAVRPFVSAAVVDRVVAALRDAEGALVALPVTDTVKRAGEDRRVAATVPREGLWTAQTPQGFRFASLLAAHRHAAATGRDDLTDDAAVAEWAGLEVVLVEESAATSS